MRLVVCSTIVLLVSLCSNAYAACSTNGLTTTCRSDDGANGVGQDAADGMDLAAPSYSGVPPLGENRFEAGGGGSTVSPSFNGGNGGDVSGTVVLNVTVPNSIPGNPAAPLGSYDFQLYLQGGNGGTGGSGGRSGDGGDTADIVGTISGQNGADINIGSISGHGGGGQSLAPNTGNAGRSGDINLHLLGEFREVTIGAVGGGGIGSIGDTTLGRPGDAGNVTVRLDGNAEDVFIYSASGNSENDAHAIAGSVVVVLSGRVEDDLRTQSAYKAGPVNDRTAGPVTVRLENGAEVGGTIINDYGNGRLEFAMQVGSQAELDAASASLSVAGSSGTATINGKSYAWTGFNDLANLITLLQQQSDGGKITVSFSSNSVGEKFTPLDSTGATSPRMRRIICNKRGFYAYVGGGRIRLEGTIDRKAFTIGFVEALKFVPAHQPAWSVTLAQDGNSQLIVDLITPERTKVARCIVTNLE